MEGSTLQMRQSQRIKLRSLNSEGKYRIGNSETVYSGDYLMNIGVEWPVHGAYKSKILDIKQL